MRQHLFPYIQRKGSPSNFAVTHLLLTGSV
jgi:hypothetical protein